MFRSERSCLLDEILFWFFDAAIDIYFTWTRPESNNSLTVYFAGHSILIDGFSFTLLDLAAAAAAAIEHDLFVRRFRCMIAVVVRVSPLHRRRAATTGRPDGV